MNPETRDLIIERDGGENFTVRVPIPGGDYLEEKFTNLSTFNSFLRFQYSELKKEKVFHIPRRIMEEIQKQNGTYFEPISFSLQLQPRSVQHRLVRTRTHVYADPHYERYLRIITNASRLFAPDVPWNCPVALVLDIIFRSPSPEKWGEPAPVKPDYDNIIKGVGDALTQAGFWTDDKLICKADLSKHYGETDRMDFNILTYADHKRLTTNLAP